VGNANVTPRLVESLRKRFGYRGPSELPCEARFSKGQEMGWFQHGSTILVFAPPGFSLAQGITTGAPIRMGQALMHLPHLPTD
jgi:phosphatidylserine decarboxylase